MVYTIRVYNEGEVVGWANTNYADHLPWMIKNLCQQQKVQLVPEFMVDSIRRWKNSNNPLSSSRK